MKIVFIDGNGLTTLQKLSSELCMLGHEVRLIDNLELIIYKQKISKEKDFTIRITPLLVKDKKRFKYFLFNRIPAIVFSLIIPVYISLFYRIGDIYFYRVGRVLGFMMKLAQKLLKKPVIDFKSMSIDPMEFEKRCYFLYQDFFKKR